MAGGLGLATGVNRAEDERFWDHEKQQTKQPTADWEGFQRAVEADRAKRRRMSPEEFDRWDMEWRKRGRQAGFDEQEVDAFLDSIWEGEGSDPGPAY